MRRRASLEDKLRRQIVSGSNSEHKQRTGVAHPSRIELEIENGIVLVGGDCHYWPEPATLMHAAFVRFCKDHRPRVVIMNGDVVDLGQISRHPPIGWDKLPEAYDEVITAQDRLGEIAAATFKARKIWTLGNHDSRYETRLATVAPQFRKIPGTSLCDHFPDWEPCWRVDINAGRLEPPIIVKHRGKGGKHDAYNNALHSGATIITGHTHHPYVRAITDARGTRYGVNGGMLADPDARARTDVWALWARLDVHRRRTGYLRHSRARVTATIRDLFAPSPH